MTGRRKRGRLKRKRMDGTRESMVKVGAMEAGRIK